MTSQEGENMNIDMMLHRIAGILIPIVGLAAAACAQPPAPGREQPPPPVVSPEVSADRRLTLRLFAPQAQAVRLTGSDIPGVGPGVAMTKGENGVWEVTLGPLDPGAYRYTFNVDGVPVVDPRSPSVPRLQAAPQPPTPRPPAPPTPKAAKMGVLTLVPTARNGKHQNLMF